MTASDRHSIEFDGETFNVDAALIAESLGIDASQVQPLMREGRITSRCERGIDTDAGRYRLTFFHGRLRALLTVDATGALISRAIEADSGEPRRRSVRGEMGR